MNITLKGIPPTLYQNLNKRAEQHGNSLNKEIISVLETAVTQQRTRENKLLEKIEQRRDRMNHIVKQDELDTVIARKP